MECENRVVVLIDMDCFYCQVEEKLNPELKGKPIAVVQYNPWKGGGIIAVNYVARAMGVTRHMRGDEAKEKCPEIQLPSVPCSRGKADITKYREAGKDVARVLQRFTPLLERASIDEAYLDITETVQQRLKTLNVNSITAPLIPNTYALGYDNVEQFVADVHSCGSDSIEFDYEHAQRLLVGAVIVSEVRAAVYDETGYRCSAGIAHNKILAKLVCGMNKPNKQTILPTHSINILYKTLPLKKVKHLGGKFGYTVCEGLKISTMADLQKYTEKELQNKFDEKNGTWLYNIARGIDLEPVQARFNPKSIGCCKQFRGKAALLTLDCLRKWLKDLGDEIDDRLEQDALETNRTPKQMVVSYAVQIQDGSDTSSSRSYNFTMDDDLCGDFFSSKALELLMESAEGVKVKDGEVNRKLKAPIKFLGISVGKFEDHSDAKKTRNIKDYFAAGSSKTSCVKKDKNTKKDAGKDYILQKFFQISEKSSVDKNTVKETNTTAVLESTLDQQESFFAKMLNNKKIDIDNKSIESDSSYTNKAIKPATPTCEVVNHGEDSNDTEYSGSTINNEINKSIALFEDEPTDFDRITNIRQLLKKSTLQRNLEKTEASLGRNSDPTEPNKKIQDQQGPVPSVIEVDTFRCPECGKHISIDMVEMHSDYHMALKLREEEREKVRKETRVKRTTKKENYNPPPSLGKKKKVPDESGKIDNTQSITSFLVKICDRTMTQSCTECGKKVAVDKMVEHLDFHEAQKLSRELNHHHKPSIFQSNSTTKRKRTSTSPTKKQKMPKCKSIDSFFKVT